MQLSCLGQCGQPACQKIYKRLDHYDNHVAGAPRASKRSSLWHTAKCGPFEYIEYWAHECS